MNLDHDPDTATVGDILTMIQDAADAAAVEDKFEISVNETQTGIVLFDRTGGPQPFEVRRINGSIAKFDLALFTEGDQITEESTDLAINGSALHGDTAADHFMLTRGEIDAEFALTASDIDGTGLWGQLEVDVISGTASGLTTIAIDLTDPGTEADDGVATLRELNGALGAPDTLIALKEHGGAVSLDLPLLLSSSFAGVVGETEVIFHADVNDINDPDSLQFTFLPAPGNPVLELLNAVEKLTVNDVVTAIEGTGDYLAQLESQDLLAYQLPGLNQSIGQLLGFSNTYEDLMQSLVTNPPQTLQGVEAALNGLNGVSGVALTLDDTSGAESLKVELTIDLPQLDAQIPLTLDLTTLGGDLVALGLDPVSVVMDSAQTSPLDVFAGGTINLALGVDLSDEDNPQSILFDTTSITLEIEATQPDLDFGALFGAMAVEIIDGIYTLDVDGEGGSDAPAQYRTELATGVNGRHLIDDAAALTTVQLDGALDVDLPVQFPLPIAPGQPHLLLQITDLSQSVATTTLTGPDVALLLSDLSLEDNLDSFRQGWDELFMELDHALDEAVFSHGLPLLGDQLTGAFDSIDQIRSKVADNLAQVQGTLTAQDIQLALFEALGFSGLNWLQDTNGDGAVTQDDIQVVSTSDEILFELDLALPPQTVQVPVDLDLNLPGLDLDFDDALINVDIGFTLPLMFGISIADGVFIDVSALNELSITVEATLPQIDDAPAVLSGLLPYLVSDDPDNPSLLSGTYTLDLTDAGGNDPPLPQ